MAGRGDRAHQAARLPGAAAGRGRRGRLAGAGRGRGRAGGRVAGRPPAPRPGSVRAAGRTLAGSGLVPAAAAGAGRERACAARTSGSAPTWPSGGGRASGWASRFRRRLPVRCATCGWPPGVPRVGGSTESGPSGMASRCTRRAARPVEVIVLSAWTLGRPRWPRGARARCSGTCWCPWAAGTAQGYLLPGRLAAAGRARRGMAAAWSALPLPGCRRPPPRRRASGPKPPVHPARHLPVIRLIDNGGHGQWSV